MKIIHEVIRRPLVTEKSNYQNSTLRQYVFEVAGEATKGLVKDAIETLFDVDVVRVNMMNMPMKRKRNLRNRRMVSRRVAFKKAIVTLAEGQTIAAFEGVK